jgi:hypothetical protein
MGGSLGGSGGEPSGGAPADGGGGSGGFTSVGGAGGGGSEAGGAPSGGTDGAGGGAGEGATGGFGGAHDEDSGFNVSEGRLPASPRFCWVRPNGGTLSDEEWFARRALFQATMTEWQGESALAIQWAEGCQVRGTGTPEEVRILLDDRDTLGTTIPNCSQLDRLGPWALYPNEAAAFADCLWNMVLPAKLETLRVVLKAAGHALGYSHSVWRTRAARLACPDPLEYEAFSPYVDYYDADSVMHPGASVESAFAPDPFDGCTYEEGLARRSLGLSAGDRLAIEMLYPRADAPTFGASTWLSINDVPTFRADDGVYLQNDWVARGANPDWFDAYYWLVGDSLGRPIVTLSELSPTPALPGPASYGAFHLFRDPFGITHQVAVNFNTDTQTHTALTIAVVY